MEIKTFIPISYKSIYTKNTEKKTFVEYIQTETEENVFHAVLTPLVRLEKNNGYNSITGANILLRIHNGSNWSKCTLTGLRPTETKNFYYADLPTIPQKSLLVVKCDSENEILEIRICSQFYPLNATERTRIVNAIIQNF